MNRPRSASLLLGFLLLPLRPSFAQESVPRTSLTIDSVMSAKEQASTGILSLTAAQRAAFEQWLNRYTSVVLEVARESSQGTPGRTAVAAPPAQPRQSQVYGGVGGGHWIENNGDGKIITLEDGSIWQINPVDQVDTALWLATTDITVLHADSPVGEYRYVLIDKDDGEKALAKYLGRE